MASVYTNDLRLEEIGSGEQSGTWGDTTNTNLELIAEAFSFGTEAITTNADTHTTTIADGATDPGRSIYLKYTGTLDSACTITIAPNTVSKLWFIENGTSGSQNIIISQGSGASITIPPGDTKAIYSDGAGSGAAMVDAFASLNVVDLKVQDDLTLSSDAAVLGFGADTDTTLTHVADTGLLLNSTRQLQFNDASQFINAPSATVLDINATDEIELNATLIDVNGNADISGTLGVTGIATFTDDIIIGDGKTIGSASDVDAMTIASNGQVTFTQTLIGTALDISGDIDVDGTTNLDVVDIDGAVDMASTLTLAGNADFNGDLDVDGTTNLDAVDVDGAVNFAADVTFADGADIITASAGTSNFRAGVNAGNSIASGGNYNVVVGDEAGTALTTGDANVAVGFEALKTEDANGESVAVGYQALKTQNVGVSALNTAVGYLAGTAITTGIQNVIVGSLAGDAMTDADGNIAIGHQALTSNILGSASVAVGGTALFSQNPTTAASSLNTAIGHSAGYRITTGTFNTCVGGNSGTGITTGLSNTVVGYNAASTDGLTGSNNTFVGRDAGNDQTTASQNVFIGSFAGDSCVDGENNTIVGYNSGLTSTGTSQVIVLGSQVTSQAANNFTFGFGATDSNIAFGATSITAPSDVRLKEDIQDEKIGLDFIKDLRSVTFR